MGGNIEKTKYKFIFKLILYIKYKFYFLIDLFNLRLLLICFALRVFALRVFPPTTLLGGVGFIST